MKENFAERLDAVYSMFISKNTALSDCTRQVFEYLVKEAYEIQNTTSINTEQKNKEFFIVIRKDKYDEASWVEFVTDDYIAAVNKFKDMCCDNEYIYRLYKQDENGNILSCHGSDYDIDKQ